MLEDSVDQSETPDLNVNEQPDEGRKAKAAQRQSGPIRNFPVFSLEKALAVGKVIKTNNAGNPWPPTEVARALNFGSKSSSVDRIFRASSLYGITTGTRAASAITLEKIGRDILYAPNPDEELRSKRLAFLNVEPFSKVLEYYKGNNLPAMEFLSNTLFSEFGIPIEFHQEFKELFEENCRFVEIGSDWQGLDNTSRSIARGSNEGASTTSSHSLRKNSTQKCFVIMPFWERTPNRSKGFFDEVYNSLIKPAAEEAGFEVYTANKDGSDVIQSTIINELISADLVIADLEQIPITLAHTRRR
ncbi:MAG: hypothetical protein KGR68_09485 [Betaproteobacteria bacterium]|nr:hypothetical protein [Betaproteobacteria bacterium]